jgi:hypothetical protein
MTLPVHVEQTNGTFIASLLGDSKVRADGPTREAALESLRAELLRKRAAGELVWLTIEPLGVTDLAGIWADDPTLDDMVAEIYRQRDAERPTE